MDEKEKENLRRINFKTKIGLKKFFLIPNFKQFCLSRKRKKVGEN